MYVTGKEGYDVLRLIEHGQTCYISSEYVEGSILAGWLKSRPKVTKEQLFSLMREIVNQLSMIHKCRKKPYYQYVNPYSIVVTDEDKPYFLDLEAGSNEKRLRFMQRRVVRECFLPKEEAYYQRGSAKLDIYGMGRTIQYLLDAAVLMPPLSGREERRFLKIISKCLNAQSNSAYQSAADIRRNIPQYKKKTEHNPVLRRRLLLSAGAAVILGGAWKVQETGGLYGADTEELSDMTQKHIFQEDTWQEREAQEDLSQKNGEDLEEFGFQSEILMRGSGEAYMELALAYILDLEDYEKSLYYLDKIQEYAMAVNLREVAEALMGKEKEPEVLEESLRYLEEKGQEDSTGQYDRCLMKGYSLLDTKDAAEAILRLGRRCLDKTDDGEETKEIRKYLALAYERMGEFNEAAQLYEEMLDLETDAARREEMYGRLVTLYENSGHNDRAVEICVQGIGELDNAEKLKITHMRLLCQDAAIGRDLCAQTIQEYLAQSPELLENEGFQEIMREYEIQVEGEQVWVGR